MIPYGSYRFGIQKLKARPEQQQPAAASHTTLATDCSSMLRQVSTNLTLLAGRLLSRPTLGVFWRFPWNSTPLPAIGSLAVLDQAVWFAVPKQKVSRMKKRLKATLRDRIKKRHDIITDPRTGERTLQHRLPENWKDYLPDANLSPQ